jgi:hypothetical protein
MFGSGKEARISSPDGIVAIVSPPVDNQLSS